MTEDLLIRARKKAERAVEDMDDGPLKVAAFQTILGRLLAESKQSTERQDVSAKVPAGDGGRPNTLIGRILTLRSEGFFETQRSLGEVREGLGVKAWRYPVTTLSGAMQSLVRQRQLRRERLLVDNKRVWKYSNP